MSGYTVKCDSGLFIGDVDVAPVSGTIEITENGNDIDVARYAKANVDVSGLGVAIDTAANTILQCEPIPTNGYYDLEIPDNNEYNTLGGNCCSANSNIRTVTIGNNITHINGGDALTTMPKAGAFVYCRNLNRVYGGGEVVFIGNYSFCMCQNLEDIDLNGNKLIEIGHYAFYGCQNFNKPNFIFDALECIGQNAFGYSGITTIKIIKNTASACTIGGFAFCFCNNITKIVFNGKNGNINLGNEVFFGSTLNLNKFAILGDFSTGWATSFANCTISITDFYTDLNQTDFTTWLNNLNDNHLKDAITNATNIHYEYAGDGSEL